MQGWLRASPRSEIKSLGTGGTAEKSNALRGSRGQEQGALKAPLTSEATVHF